jgi:hypothetical protein
MSIDSETKGKCRDCSFYREWFAPEGHYMVCVRDEDAMRHINADDSCHEFRSYLSRWTREE